MATSASPELNQINWTAVQAASDTNPNGSIYPPGAGWVTASTIVFIDGGLAGQSMIYTTPLHPVVTVPNPSSVNVVIAPGYNDANHDGQVIISGSDGARHYPGIDLSDQSGCAIQGSINWSTWRIQNGEAEPGMAITGWPVGIYIGDANWAKSRVY